MKAQVGDGAFSGLCEISRSPVDSLGRRLLIDFHTQPPRTASPHTRPRGVRLLHQTLWRIYDAKSRGRQLDENRIDRKIISKKHENPKKSQSSSECEPQRTAARVWAPPLRVQYCTAPPGQRGKYFLTSFVHFNRIKIKILKCFVVIYTSPLRRMF